MNDGGSAFPSKTMTHGIAGENGEFIPVFQDTGGMTLRDYFAGQALIALGQWLPAGYGNLDSAAAFHVRASISYKQADAMIAERNKKAD